uniref:Uncharacterized protein n=1 Tax=Anguilla anguilla TaxID=7936 RepID=A0A0E9X4D4_ANGAN
MFVICSTLRETPQHFKFAHSRYSFTNSSLAPLQILEHLANESQFKAGRK